MRLFRRSKAFSALVFEKREDLRSDYRIVADALLALLPFDSVLDVGCANGLLLEPLLSSGKTARGIEVSPAVVEVLSPRLLEAIEIGDFSSAAGCWDLVCCIEVAEHIPADRSRELIRKLTQLATSWIYFSVAPVGQSGRGHINCRSHLEWLDWFALEGWVLDPKSYHLRQHLKQLERAHWLVSNSALLSRLPVRSNEVLSKEGGSSE